MVEFELVSEKKNKKTWLRSFNILTYLMGNFISYQKFLRESNLGVVALPQCIIFSFLDEQLDSAKDNHHDRG